MIIGTAITTMVKPVTPGEKIMPKISGMYFARRTERKNFVEQSEGVSEGL